ncbi:unnamed protein product [Polarella glacialis]|uniref:Tubulin--tyrosine ligase-like protein 9 n=1 Tax=Polarella glacialis TaxID=89957 RepID=A0A813FK88_POLGL|nr:unnamed protein product [Polarella glacialis]
MASAGFISNKPHAGVEEVDAGAINWDSFQGPTEGAVCDSNAETATPSEATGPTEVMGFAACEASQPSEAATATTATATTAIATAAATTATATTATTIATAATATTTEELSDCPLITAATTTTATATTATTAATKTTTEELSDCPSQPLEAASGPEKPKEAQQQQQEEEQEQEQQQQQQQQQQKSSSSPEKPKEAQPDEEDEEDEDEEEEDDNSNNNNRDEELEPEQIAEKVPDNNNNKQVATTNASASRLQRSSSPARSPSITSLASHSGAPSRSPSPLGACRPSSSSRPPRPSSAARSGKASTVAAKAAQRPAAPVCAAIVVPAKVPPVSAKVSPAAKASAPRRKGGQVLFNASHSDYEVVANAAESRSWKVVKVEEEADNCNVHWIDDSAIGDWMKKIQPWMRINHFPGMNNALARKTRLARNMARVAKLFPAEYRFLPPTWVLPDDLADLERRFGDSKESKVFYIVKPDHLCQGKGIFLTTELDRLRQVSAESRQKNEASVVQRYISKPMLIDDLKFDLRLYFLVAGKRVSEGNLDLRCFLFRDGLVRLCTQAYQPPTAETMNDKCMHLTNYAINKNSKDFVPNAGADGDGEGSKRSLRWFMSWVEHEWGEKERKKLWLKLMALCVKTVLTVSPTLEGEYSGAFPRDLSGGQFGCRCFEVLGIDVMLDAKRKPYLIEVNHLPSFAADSPLDEDIKTRLVNQVMDLTCASLCGKDKKFYDQVVKERREASGGTSLAAAAPSDEATSIMDLPVYKDFERAYPPPEGAPKLAAQLEAIVTRVRELFKPVHTVRKRSESKDPQDRPPLPPKQLSSAAAPKGGSLDASSGAARGYPSSRSAPDGPGSRSRSAPGPPRCALPPISRGPLSPPGRGRSSTADETGRPTRAASAKPLRQTLVLKSAQLYLPF